MDYTKIDKKWQQKWEDTKISKFNKKNVDKKYYVLEMLPYPSAAKLHVGHWYNYGPSDTFARFKKMQGYEVFQPMGFDAFGLPAENYAIKTGIHPETSTLQNIKNMEVTLKEIGMLVDWDHELSTCLPEYYKWTQWLFLQLYKNKLAYRKNAPVNWCTSCNTVLANEQVVDGLCERCNSPVIHKNLTQWFFKITDYAEELLTGLDKLDWPEKTKAMQKNWIGKSTGTQVAFTAETGDTFDVFTTRVDTLFGVEYVVLSPEHILVDKLTTPKYKKAVQKYKNDLLKINEIERLSATREKTGQFIGAYAINPINNKKIPIWIADYVLATYGTGAVMGVPAHDERDFEFAKKYKLPITRVIKGKKGQDDKLPFTELGILTNSKEYSDLPSKKAQSSITKDLIKIKKGAKKTNYRLRDWLVSRQRYWGCPIPIIHCEKCGDVPVPDKDLPVLLPKDVNFEPTGESPLSKSKSFMETTCPICKGKATRDADTLDTFVCSSWYFLRYLDPRNNKKAFDKKAVNKMLPVDKYIGGSEHACMHLLYARFFTKVLRDMGLLDFDEPFTSLVHQGLILGPDNFKMSKSRGNVVSPDDYVKKYGSDAFRMYLMFGFSYTEGGPWNPKGIESIVKFFDRVTRLVKTAKENKSLKCNKIDKKEKEINYRRHYSIKNVTLDLEKFSFNTAIARIMEFVNTLYDYIAQSDKKNFNGSLFYDCVYDLIKILAPFAPHLSEELNEILGKKYSIFNTSFPTYDEKALVKNEYELAVQVNSKIRTKIIVPNDMSKKEIEKIALDNEDVKKHIKGKTVRKVIVIPNRLVNIVVG